jgi:proton-translocating NADH-quinone oxidoreductase chain L
MLMLVMSNNFLQLFFGWEAVGLVSYLLIGFWFKRPTAIFANLKAFLVNRVGDFGFLLGIAGVLYWIGTLDYATVFANAGAMRGQTFTVWPGHEWSVPTVICICLFIGAMGKSAQVPLHVWLPDSMEGPTPISALIHAATMVTAGIFMVARMSPLFETVETALNFILVIGATTAFFTGLIGIVQNDIKRVVAYSTLSQLGYMTVALGVSAYSAAVFHLMTHAFFKALLFLGAGSVIIGMHHEQDMRKMGGLRKYMPITHLTVDRHAGAGRHAVLQPASTRRTPSSRPSPTCGRASGQPDRAVRQFRGAARRVRHQLLQLPPALPHVPSAKNASARPMRTMRTATMRMRTTPTMPTRITTTTAMATARTSRTSRHGW